MRWAIAPVAIVGLLLGVWFSLSGPQRERMLSQLQATFGSPPPPAPAPAAPVPVAEKPPEAPFAEALSPVRCVPRDAVTKAKPELAGVYRWRDANGRMHFGEKPPEQAASAPENLSSRFSGAVRHVALVIDAGQEALPAGVIDTARAERLNADAERIFRVFARHVPALADLKIRVTLHAFASANAFAAYRDARDQRSRANAGLYDSLAQEIAVQLTGDAPYDDAVMRHELTHAIAHQMLGHPPIWFDEGMGEVFRLLRYEGDAWRVEPQARRSLSLLEHRTADEAWQYLGMETWPVLDPATDYAEAWALSAFLLTGPYPHLFGRWIEYLQENYCRQIDSRDFMKAAYPGGMTQWKLDWRDWMRRQQAGDGAGLWQDRL